MSNTNETSPQLPYPNDYEPSDYVKSVVGRTYRSTFGIFKCVGFDPRLGFWMHNTENNDDLRNISIRAIDRTYHKFPKNQE